MSDPAPLNPLERIAEAPADHYRVLKISDLDGDRLLELSKFMKLSLSREDMLAIQAIYAEWKREPTDVELEVIAQTWSEHCKHRIFGATIEHEIDGKAETVNSLFKTYLDDKLAICLKAETHNHPSAIEPYAGANTGLGGVIRDILGAGKGAKPIASLDVFCFGAPDTTMDHIKANDVIHPLGVMRGVVRGVVADDDGEAGPVLGLGGGRGGGQETEPGQPGGQFTAHWRATRAGRPPPRDGRRRPPRPG